MKLLIFAASHRPASVNRTLAKLAAQEATALGAQVDFAEYADFDMPLYNDAQCDETGVPEIATAFARRAQDAQGIVISSPEYNWSYPGSLKNILDWTSRLSPRPLAKKTALLLSATPGSRGGIVGLNHLKTPLEALQMFVFPKVFPLGHSDRAFDDHARLREPKQQQLFSSLIKDYIDFTRHLS